MDFFGWANMNMVEHIYLLIAVGATVVLLMQLLLACISGLDVEMHHGGDMHHGDGDVGIHFQLLTPRSVVAFFTLFGWTGLAFYNAGTPLYLTIILSFLCGLCMMAVTGLTFMFLYKLQAEGTMNMKNAVGCTGEVYIIVPEKRTGYGKVNVVVQGQKRELHAITDGTPLQAGTQVKITDIINNQLLVERV